MPTRDQHRPSNSKHPCANRSSLRAEPTWVDVALAMRRRAMLYAWLPLTAGPLTSCGGGACGGGNSGGTR
jgi:hypothetical protein